MTLKDAEELILAFLKEECLLAPKTCPLAGNSVHYDKAFIEKDMPRFHEFLHYRIVDVSSIKECAVRWIDQTRMPRMRKEMTHRALDDIRESIAELKLYKEKIFDAAFKKKKRRF